MKKESKIKILVADAQPVLLQGLRSIFAEQPDMEFAGEAKTEDEVLLLAEKLKPNLVLLDTAETQWNGLEILTASPETPTRLPCARFHAPEQP